MAVGDRASRGRRTNGRRGNRRDTDRVVQWLRAGAVAAGVGAAIVSGEGVAVAVDDPAAGETAKTSESRTASNVDPDTSANSETATDADPKAVEPKTTTDTTGLDQGSGNPRGTSVGGAPISTVSAQTNTGGTPLAAEPDPEPEPETEPEPEPEPGREQEPGPEPDLLDAKTAAAPEARATNAPPPTSPPAVLRRMAAATEPDTRPEMSGSNDDADSQAVTFAAKSGAAADITTTAVAPLHPPIATAAVTTVTPEQIATIRPVRDLVLSILSIFGYTPGTTVGHPFGDLIWGVFRRFESAFDNQRPTAVAASITDSSLTDGGQVNITGTVDFDDDDGDPLAYSATDGAHGSVVVDADGNITYTPTDPSYTGTDTFTVTASDEGPHLHGLLGLFQADGGHTRTATVAVTLTAAPNDAPVIDSVTSDPGTGNTWTVTVDTTDPDGDPVIVTVIPDDDGFVTVTAVDGQPNTFTVTVADTDWAAANPRRQVVVTVRATDGITDAEPTVLAIGTVNNVTTIGLNYDGSLNIPALPPGVYYTQVSALSHTVLLRSDGTAVAVGNNTFGQLDIPDPPEGLKYTQVSAGAHTALLLSDGTVVVVGAIPADGPIVIPPLPAGLKYTQVSTANGYVAMLRSDGTVVTAGRITNSSLPSVAVPPLPPGVTYTQVAAGSNHLALLRSDGKVVDVSFTGNVITRTPPVGVTYTKIAAGSANVVMLRSDGKADIFAVLNGPGASVPALPPGVVYTEVASGSLHQLFRRSDGVIVGSNGPNDYGQNVIPTPPDGVVVTQFTGGYRSTFLLTAIDA